MISLFNIYFRFYEVGFINNLLLLRFFLWWSGIICSEDALWKDQRKLAIDCLKKIGMVSFGNNREFLEARIINGVKMCFKVNLKIKYLIFRN